LSVLYREVVVDALNSLDVSGKLRCLGPFGGTLDVALQGHETLVGLHMHFHRAHIGVFRERRLHLRRDGGVVDSLAGLLAGARTAKYKSEREHAYKGFQRGCCLHECLLSKKMTFAHTALLAQPGARS